MNGIQEVEGSEKWTKKTSFLLTARSTRHIRRGALLAILAGGVVNCGGAETTRAERSTEVNPTMELATTVNSILSDYIAINDLVLGHSFRKIAPIPGIFKPIDFCGHEASLTQLLRQLEATREEIPNLKESRPPHGPFLDAMNKYVIGLGDAVRRLGAISGKLCEKSRGTRVYSWDEYRKEMKEYNAAVRSYQALGEPLQALVPTIQM